MTWEVIVVYVMLLLTVVLFVTDRVRTDIVGVLIIVVLGALGILKPKDLLLGFSNEALVTIAAMFVLSARRKVQLVTLSRLPLQAVLM